MLSRFFQCVAIFIGISSFSAHSSPWVGTTDPQLHYDIQTLTDHGYLDAVSNTFPVPWIGISAQIEQLNITQMPEVAAVAARRLHHYLVIQKRSKSLATITAYGANERSRFASFDGQQGEKARLNINAETRVKRLAAKLSVNAERGGETNFDQSYLAYQFGDFNLRLGSIDQWWGPTHSNSLILSNNARPIPTLALSRSSAAASESPWLSFLGPWYATAQVGQLEDSRDVPEAKIWASRFTAKPISGLELGLSWVAVWGGDGQPDRFKDFFKVLTFHKRCSDGADECDSSLYTSIGSHLAGLDFKYTFQLGNTPVSFYGQYIDEGDSSQFNVANQANSFGASTYFFGGKVYLESSDTNVSCDSTVVDVTNCFYESGTYSSGYRYYSRELGDNRESDASMVSLGYLKHFSDGDVMEATVRLIDIDDSNNDNTAVGLMEKITQLSGYYQTVWGNWQLKIGGVLDSSNVNEQGTSNDFTVFTEIKYSL